MGKYEIHAATWGAVLIATGSPEFRSTLQTAGAVCGASATAARLRLEICATLADSEGGRRIICTLWQAVKSARPFSSL